MSSVQAGQGHAAASMMFDTQRALGLLTSPVEKYQDAANRHSEKTKQKKNPHNLFATNNVKEAFQN